MAKRKERWMDMKIIYTPRGKALEYAPLACNLYFGCPHSCAYCFGPTLPNPAKKGLTMPEWRDIWHSKTVAKVDCLRKFEDDTCTMRTRGDKRPVLFCFACDPYPPDEPIADDKYGTPMTREALFIMWNQGLTPIILTKGGTRACRDFDILKAAGGWFGQTIGLSVWECKAWEPNAAPLVDRVDALITAIGMEIKTWISVEPVIDAKQTLDLIDALTIRFDDSVSHFKLGKLSGYDKETKAVEKSIDWPEYREQAREILTGAGYREIFEPGVFEVGTYYVKAELRNAK